MVMILASILMEATHSETSKLKSKSDYTATPLDDLFRWQHLQFFQGSKDNPLEVPHETLVLWLEHLIGTVPHATTIADHSSASSSHVCSFGILSFPTTSDAVSVLYSELAR